MSEAGYFWWWCQYASGVTWPGCGKDVCVSWRVLNIIKRNLLCPFRQGCGRDGCVSWRVLNIIKRNLLYMFRQEYVWLYGVGIWIYPRWVLFFFFYSGVARRGMTEVVRLGKYVYLRICGWATTFFLLQGWQHLSCRGWEAQQTQVSSRQCRAETCGCPGQLAWNSLIETLHRRTDSFILMLTFWLDAYLQIEIPSIPWPTSP